MQTTETVFEYHERTKHRPGHYAASPGYLDWATQPDPFRTFTPTALVPLPLPDEEDSPAYSAVFGTGLPPEPLTAASLSGMLRYGLGLAAKKCLGDECWMLRCNASSGNLHPTEGYILAPPISGICSKSFIAHYRPKTHALEILHTFDCELWDSLPGGSFLFALTSIPWREAWKYGERAFRYTQLDAGHALRALSASAAMQGWKSRLIDEIDIENLDKMLGLNLPARFTEHEEEIADCLCIVSPEPVDDIPDVDTTVRKLDGHVTAEANRLSPAHRPWEAVSLIERATHVPLFPLEKRTEAAGHRPKSPLTAAQVVLRRRSAQAMDFARSRIAMNDFLQVIRSARIAFEPFEPACSFILFVHDVETLAPGLYLYSLNERHLLSFRKEMRDDFLFRPVDTDLYLLESGDFRPQAKLISCSQDIAYDSGFALGMLCEFETQILRYGASRYKSLHWECGAVGQQLYLEATSLGLSATGIGCFLDDVMHRLLGLEGRRFQSLYHLTVGRAVVDMRLDTEPPYIAE